MTINETLVGSFNSQRSGERNNWVDRVWNGRAINGIFMTLRDMPENTTSSRGNGNAISIHPFTGRTCTREERGHNFPIGRLKRRRRARSRNVFSAPYVKTLDNEASWNRDLPMSVNSFTGNEDTGTNDKCTFNEVLRSLDEMRIYYLLRRERSRTKKSNKTIRWRIRRNIPLSLFSLFLRYLISIINIFLIFVWILL